MSGIFIRGDKYPLSSQFFYLAAKDRNNNYYFLVKAVKEDLTSNAVFCALKSQYIKEEDLINVSFSPSSTPALYTMNGFTQNSVTGTFEIRDNIIDLVPNSTVKDNILISDNLGPSIYLYPGIYISIKDSNGKDVLWKIQNNENNKKPVQGYRYDTLQIMLLQKNEYMKDGGNTQDRTFNIWDGNDCVFSSSPLDILTFFEDWVAGKQINCQQTGHVGSINKGCLFTSFKSCNYGYLYSLCDNQLCNNCLGLCLPQEDGNILPCSLTYDKKDEGSFMTCNEVKENKVKDIWEQYKIYIIIGICLFVFLIIIIIVAVVLSAKNKNKSGG
jgi:hypothetical protein